VRHHPALPWEDERAVELVREAMGKARYGYLFPGFSEGRPLSNMAMLKLLQMMEYDGITVHGFWSTFRDWAAECTDYPDSLAEDALAHTISSMAEAAYRRRDRLERRRGMMDDWAQYCAGAHVPIVSTASHLTQTFVA
jgi:integrase